MDPRILALIAQAAGETVAGVGGGVSKIDWLSPEQRNKMKELERQQALGLLGLDEGAQQRILNQQLQPVQALGRQATQQAQQSQLIGDVGQGAAFRQQAAQQGALQQATIEATQRGQQQTAQMDELARARQLAEMRSLQKQRQKNKEGITDIVGSLAGGAAMAGQIGMAKTELDTLEKSFGVKVGEKQKKALKQMGGKTTPTFEKTFLGALQALRSSDTTAPVAPTLGTTAPKNKIRDMLRSLFSDPEKDIVPRIGPEEIVPRIGPEEIVPRIGPEEIVPRIVREEIVSGIESGITPPVVPSTEERDIGWGTATIIRDDTGNPIRVNVVGNDENKTEYPYTPDTDGWATILADIGKARNPVVVDSARRSPTSTGTEYNPVAVKEMLDTIDLNKTYTKKELKRIREFTEEQYRRTEQEPISDDNLRDLYDFLNEADDAYHEEEDDEEEVTLPRTHPNHGGAVPRFMLYPRTYGYQEAFTQNVKDGTVTRKQDRKSGAGHIYFLSSQSPFTVNGRAAERWPSGWVLGGLKYGETLEVDASKKGQIFKSKPAS